MRIVVVSDRHLSSMALVDAMRHIPHSRVIAAVKAPDDARSYCQAGDADVVVCDAATMLGDGSDVATALAVFAAKELARADHAATALPDKGRFPWQIEPCQVLALSAREREVFALLGLGLSNRHVARALGVTELTVKTHVGRVLAKLKLESRLQAGLAALLYLAQQGSAGYPRRAVAQPDDGPGDTMTAARGPAA